MRLLVSVRSAEEARSALAGGADIVDAKEPARGSLGAVDASTLQDIAAAVPGTIPLSVALGDCHRAADAAAAVASVMSLAGRTAPLYFKLGFAGAGPRDVTEILRVAVEAAGVRADGATIVAAAYADHAAVSAPAPALVAAGAARAGAVGVLLDTGRKDGRDLLHWMSVAEVERWVASARQAGLLTAIAGSLTEAVLPRVTRSGADVLGVRAAACEGGRNGLVDVVRVRRLAASTRAVYAAVEVT